MDISTFLIQCLNALQYGLLLFLVASGLTLIFGIMGVINLAHGSFYMMGAYMAYALAPIVAATFGGGFFATLLVGVVLAVISSPGFGLGQFVTIHYVAQPGSIPVAADFQVSASKITGFDGTNDFEITTASVVPVLP